ncbi:TPA: hypothetical protein PMB01_001638 [Vibrio cholerae]|nr:hypothetical protein [Vibrio cholerae]
MSDNDYYKRTKEFDPRTRANGLDVEFELDAISAAFDKIPAPREDGQGYDGPIHVGAATAPTHAVQLQQMEAQLGDNTENANRAEEAAERAEEARDIAIEKARQSGEARDEALEAAATVTNIHREQLEKALGVNARVYPRLTNQNLKVGDVIPAPEDTADGLPITHVIVDGNAYAMSPIKSGLVQEIQQTYCVVDGIHVELIKIKESGFLRYISNFSQIQPEDRKVVLLRDIEIDTYTVGSSFNLHTIDLNGFTLKVKSGVFNVFVNHDFTLDYNGGTLDLGLKSAKVAVPAPDGNKITVQDNEFEVGDILTCSFDLNGMPNDPSRSIHPNGEFNSVVSISGNILTLKYPFVVGRGGGAPGYTEIPAGAYLVNAIFTKPGFYYTGYGTLTFSGVGECKNASGGYYVTVSNVARGGSFRSKGIKYDRAGLDGFQLNCQNITFEDYYFGLHMDIAKQIIVPKWHGKMSFVRGKSAKNNFDSDIYINADGNYGDIHYDCTSWDGDNTTGMAGFLGGDSLYHLVIPAQNVNIGKVTVSDSKFPNYQRNIFGSGTLAVQSQSFKSISITASDAGCPWLYTTFDVSSKKVSTDYITVTGGSFKMLDTIRSNPGFKDVTYRDTEVIATGTVRFNECDLDGCTFNGALSGGVFVIDDRVSVGRNFIKNGAKIAVQTPRLSTTAKFVVTDFDPATATGVYFPITNYIDSSISSVIPVIDMDIQNFTENVTFGSNIVAAKYVLHINRINENNPPPDAFSRHAAIIPIGSTLKGVADVTLYKVTNLYQVGLSSGLTAGQTQITQTNLSSGEQPSIGDVVGILYSNFTVKYHRITAVSAQTFDVFPAVYENVALSGIVIYNNKTTKIY